ncbi:hypothetical protein ABZX77_23890 [Streptomyces sp. NPDC004237]|uniref:hypothetical protein n=1 Tax=Streptomyces sp. NPDC004237 TaxID=3154455 RepID=UPI0033B55003
MSEPFGGGDQAAVVTVGSLRSAGTVLQASQLSALRAEVGCLAVAGLKARRSSIKAPDGCRTAAGPVRT